mmetsp:Transcript_24819/g.69167  ORF Transcript_24819/g.69167 Transcript_24819/m.69167 type:complete len:301 (+) Transcript_24819:764-1666(+)
MEGLHGWQAAQGHVAHDLPLETLEELRAVCPVTDALKGVHEVGKCLREVGAESQRALVSGDGEVVAGAVFVGACQVGVGLRGLWLQGRHLLIALNGLCRPPLHFENATEVVVGNAQALHSPWGMKAHGRELKLYAGRVAGDGLVRSAGLPQGVSKVIVSLGEVWLQTDSLAVHADGCLKIVALVAYPRQVPKAEGTIGLKLENHSVGRFRLLKPPELLQAHTHSCVCLCICWPKPNGLLVQTECLLAVASLPHKVPETPPRWSISFVHGQGRMVLLLSILPARRPLHPPEVPKVVVHIDQ